MTVARSPRRFHVLFGTVVSVAAVCYALAAVASARAPLPSSLPLAGCLTLLFLGVRLHLPIRLGAQRVELAWGEAGLLLALAIVPTAWVLLLTPVAVGASMVQRRIPPIKTVYNVAVYTAAAAAAAAVLALTGAARPFTGLDVLALAGAGAVAGLVSYAAVAAVIATVQNVSILATWRVSHGLQVFTLAGNLALGVGVLVLARYQPWAVVTLPVVGFCMHQGYVGRLRGHQEREAGQRHAAAVGRLTADLDEPGVLRRSAEGACQLVSADAVDVEVPGHERSHAFVLYRHARSGQPWTGDPAKAPPLAAQLVAALPIPVTDGCDAGQLRVWLASTAPDMRLGQGEEAALRSLATYTGAAVTNARLHAQQTYYATHDRLTRLPARPLLIERIEAQLRAGSPAELKAVALLAIALTGYEEIQRTLGHEVAEGVLVRTARRLEAAAAADEYVAHVGADNFAVYLPTALKPAHVRSRALWLITAITRAIRLDTSDLPTTQLTLRAAVAGAAYSPFPVTSGTELLRQASVAVELARARNLNFDFYDPAEDELGGPASIILQSELHAAMEDNQLDLHYQPIVHLPSRAPIALEAMLRWYHPTRGLLYAGQFIPILERSADYPRFVAWQLERALATHKRCGDSDLPISINIAARCLLDDRFPGQVSAALQEADIPADQLMLEIDESDPLLTQAGLVNEVLTALRLMGVKIAIDRLGTGASSLSGLLKVPATHVKVDSYFVRHMLTDPEAAAVVGLALDLGRHAELQFVATGVDSDEQVAALRRRGCDTAQGRHLMRPLLADELPRYLASAPEAPVREDNVVPLDVHRRTPTP